MLAVSEISSAPMEEQLPEPTLRVSPCCCLKGEGARELTAQDSGRELDADFHHPVEPPLRFPKSSVTAPHGNAPERQHWSVLLLLQTFRDFPGLETI